MIQQMSPRLVVDYLAHGSAGHTGNACDYSARNAKSVRLTNRNNLVPCELAASKIFTGKAQAGIPRMLDVLGIRDPLKVFRSVVGFVPVDMVDMGAIRVSRNPGKSNKPVHIETRALFVSERGDAKVSGRIGKHGREFARLVHTPVDSSPAVYGRVIGEPLCHHSSIPGNLEVRHPRNISKFSAHDLRIIDVNNERQCKRIAGNLQSIPPKSQAQFPIQSRRRWFYP